MDRDLPEEMWKELEEETSKPKKLQEEYGISYKDAVKKLDEARQKTALNSNGIYSLKQNKWLKQPVQSDIPELDQDAFGDLFDKWEDRYFDLMAKYESPKEDEELLTESYQKEIDEITDFIEDLYELRKSSIVKDGEYGLGNLVFKEFRNLGYLNDLKELKIKLKNKDLSLN